MNINTDTTFYENYTDNGVEVNNPRWKVLEEIDPKGVYKIQDEKLGVIAAKAFYHHPNLTDDQVKKEALRLAGLRHPNIITIYDYVQNGTTGLMLMEYLGADWELAKKYFKVGEAKDPQELMNIIEQLSSAVFYMHANDMYHTDLHSENVMINKDSKRVMIYDLGASTAIEDSTHNERRKHKKMDLSAIVTFYLLGLGYENNGELNNLYGVADLRLISLFDKLGFNEDHKEELFELISNIKDGAFNNSDEFVNVFAKLILKKSIDSDE